RQVLRNLLSNALKFTMEGKVQLRIYTRAGTGDLAFAVEDTGIGIAPDKQQIIFEPFRQADGTTNRRFGGTGLGLSISRELASMLGGRLELHSESGKGSTFTLILPRNMPQQEERAERVATPLPVSAPIRTRRAAEPATITKPEPQTVNGARLLLIV